MLLFYLTLTYSSLFLYCICFDLYSRLCAISLLSYDALLWSMVDCTPHLFPSILIDPNLVRVWAVSVFPDFDVFISLPEIASIFTAEFYATFLALSRILFHDSDSFVIYSDSQSGLQALGSFIHAIS